jgi:AAA domain, putative AbiEii toxin, Type IV TA system/AAA ATPase domain
MIKAVKIQNFKNILDQRIELERFTVFVGANGCGKSSVLEAIEYAIGALEDDSDWEDSQVRRLKWTYTRDSVGDFLVGCETEGGYFEVVASRAAWMPKEGSVEDSRPGDWSFRFETEGEGVFEDAQSSVSPVLNLRLNAARLAAPSYSNASSPRLGSDGKGTASVLAFMALNDPDAFAELTNQFKELLPQVQRIRFRKVPINRKEIESVKIGNDSGQRQTTRTFQGEAILFDFNHAKNVAAHTASEGTLMILGLLTVLLGPNRPKTLLLDDIEHGLHPLAQKQLIAVIGQIMERFPDLQVIATAHSPYLLNYLAPEQVRIMMADVDGHALCGKLTDHPKFQTWKDEMAPGEMWSLFGEKWLAGPEAAK